ncbi:hypothetical protein CDL12_21058 [Handroanthus impetiginosus]|uniref:Uncharacterized protein n=1 Tax=Handroanthus impetiginosus TaxID=429701 RepID=A0A2G9GN03_9LAMI|nr:hypothetical protein CDL12_21058 [Handroanthus impetiginosus]
MFWKPNVKMGSEEQSVAVLPFKTAADFQLLHALTDRPLLENEEYDVGKYEKKVIL